MSELPNIVHVPYSVTKRLSFLSFRVIGFMWENISCMYVLFNYYEHEHKCGAPWASLGFGEGRGSRGRERERGEDERLNWKTGSRVGGSGRWVHQYCHSQSLGGARTLRLPLPAGVGVGAATAVPPSPSLPRRGSLCGSNFVFNGLLQNLLTQWMDFGLGCIHLHWKLVDWPNMRVLALTGPLSGQFY